MSVTALLEDALALYRRERFHSAFCLSLISVEAAAHLRYGEGGLSQYIQSSSARFRRFLNDETKSLKLKIKHAVDIPPQPQVGEPPQLVLPEVDDDWDAYHPAFTKWNSDYAQWQAAHKAAYDSYQALFKDVGDNFAGEHVKTDEGKRKRVSYLGVPRLVTTTGILYQARCELVHAGRLASVRIIATDDSASLSVSGGDPIEFSSTWIRHVLGIVAGAAEVKPLFGKR